MDKCFKEMKHFTDHPILNSLFNNLSCPHEKKERTADDEFIEYLKVIKEETNATYFNFVLKFILLFRECLNLSKKKSNETNKTNENPSQSGISNPNQNPNEIPQSENNKEINNIENKEENEKENEKDKENKDKFDSIEFSSENSGDCLPELCNEFYTEFLEKNNFFGFTEQFKAEIIEIIQHFCFWLFQNEYTKSKLSLSQ